MLAFTKKLKADKMIDTMHFRIFVCLVSKIFKITVYKTIILLVLCRCETYFHTLRKEFRLRVFENKVTRKIFGPK
jgi:hypothetical protein